MADEHDLSLRDAWEQNARAWAEWARAPGHDSYWRFHRDAFLSILPPPAGLTLDVGCGEGRLARDLRRLGHHVVAVDGAPTMVDLARAADPDMDVRLADAAALPFDSASADLVVAFMSFQDVDDMPGAIAEARRVLRDDGRVCIAVVHPLNSAGAFASEDEASAFVVEDYLSPRRYADELERDGHRMVFHSLHVPLEAYSRALEAAGLVVDALREVTMDEASIRERPERARWRRIPLFLHLRARPG
jgi:SAM-dependent methyltransferase